MTYPIWKFCIVGVVRSVALVALLLCQSALLTPASADVFHYDDFCGEELRFTEIFEVSGGPDRMYGQPSAPGDLLSIPFENFQVTANSSLEFRQGLLEMTITADDNQQFDSIRLVEFGSYLMFGSSANALLNSSAFVVVDGEVYDAAGQLEFTGGSSGSWQQELELLFPATNQVRLVIDSQLLATAGLDETAFLNKAGSSISFGSVTAAPEPTPALAIIAFSLAGLVYCRRAKLRSTEQG